MAKAWLFFLFLILPNISYAEFSNPKPHGDWAETSNKDEMTDEITKSAFVANHEDEKNMRLLIVECTPQKEFVVFVSSERLINLQGKPTKVSYRFNSDAPIDEIWNVTSNDYTALHSAADQSTLTALVKKLSETSGHLKFRYIDSDGSENNVRFSLNGSTPALKNVISYCEK